MKGESNKTRRAIVNPKLYDIVICYYILLENGRRIAGEAI